MGVYEDEVTVSRNTNLSESAYIRAGMPALMSFSVGTPSSVSGTLSVSLYAGDCVNDPAAELLSTHHSSVPIFSGQGHGVLYVKSLPNTEGITVEARLMSGSSLVKSRRQYYPLTIVRDTAEATRNEALNDLAAYYIERFAETPLNVNNPNTLHRDFDRVDSQRALYNSFSAVRILLRRAYDEEYAKIKFGADDEAAIIAAYGAAVDRFGALIDLRDAINGGDGEAYKTVGGIIKVLVRHASNGSAGVPVPVFAYVPADAIVRDALEAALESYSPGSWLIQGGAFITSLGYGGDIGKVVAGGNSSQVVYTQNNGWAIGVGSQTMMDRDALVFGQTIKINDMVDYNRLPDKSDLLWALGGLVEKYGERAMTENQIFADATRTANDWGVNLSTGAGEHGYPEDKAAAQRFADDALAALINAFPGDNLSRLDLPDDVLNATRLIAAIGDITPESGDAIAAAREAYEALDAGDQAKVPNYAALTAAEAAFARLATPAGQASAALAAALPALQQSYNANPATGSIGGEWAVLGIARGGLDTGETQIKYLGRLNALLTDKGLDGVGGADPDMVGTAPKYTEYARLTLALAALGIDGEKYSYAGAPYDLVSKLTEYDKVVQQGINGPIFALLALDTKPYLPGYGAIRDQYVQYLLNSQVGGGGWALSGDKADPDITAMALQALANYQDRSGVAAGITNGLAALRALQDPTYGGFYSEFNGVRTYNSESAAQVIAALAALGEDPTGPAWTVGGGYDPVTALLSFYDEANKTFRHTLNGAADPMATEQAVYALVALERFHTVGATRLYDMSDAFSAPSQTEAADKAGLRAAIIVAAPLAAGEYYTNASRETLISALAVAQALSANAEAAQDGVDAAKVDLLNAVDGLEYVEIAVNKA
ncbi:MAG: hypothetical protein LBK98_09790, partial [Peptococcaceae bacterium]|nr:hypothetical protein [Peptococcaceae bacterium]